MKEASPFIVGVGASAGGIEALEGMFRNVPAESELAFVIVAHLSASRESALPEIVGRFAAAPVSAARNGEKIEPNHIYVITPGTLLTTRRGRLHAAKADPLRHERHPIDVFLTSLAEDQHERAIGVILSGSGSDGALGIKAIKERGGLTVAQGADMTAPRYPGMPTSAIATGVVDLVLPVQDIVGKLADYVHRFRDVGQVAAADGEATNGEVISETRQAICTILRDQVGHDFHGYKERTFLRRVQRRMQVLQLGEIESDVERLRQGPDEVMLLFRDLLIGVTSFFRDPEAFEALESTVLPKLFESKGAGDTIRVWAPGCATGEEVYSLAILMRERMEEQHAVPKVQLFATNIDAAALEVARSDRYPATLVDAVSPERLRRFFTADGATYVLGKQACNMLSIIGAITRQTLAHTSAPKDFASVFLGRVDAMAAAYGLVAREQWGDVALADILRGQLEPYLIDGQDRARLEGPAVSLPPRASLPLGLVVHELVTNAVKHGALSLSEGRIELAWRLEDEAEHARLTIVWKEIGGPLVRLPERKGFGSDLIEREVAMDLGGKAILDYLPEGLVVALIFPLPKASSMKVA